VLKEVEIVMGFDELLFQRPFIETVHVNNWKLVGSWTNDIVGPRQYVKPNNNIENSTSTTVSF
jgi:hypothetical protein